MKKLMVLFIIIFSLFIIESENYHCGEKKGSFLSIENIMLRDYSFVENGIKAEYTTDTSIEKEQSRMMEILKKNTKLQIVQALGSIVAFDEDTSYNITLYKEEATRVEIVLINSNMDFHIDNLKKQIKKIKSNNCIDEQYFSFIKGKLKIINQKISLSIVNNIDEKTVQTIDINNGNISKAKLLDGTLVNIGQISYNTGEYLIIGTPVIFTTY